MGDRIGLRVKDSYGDTSEIVIHSHWMGRDLIKLAQEWLKDRGEGYFENCTHEEIVPDFLVWLGSNHYDQDIDLQLNEDDCEDNGVWTADVITMTVY